MEKELQEKPRVETVCLLRAIMKMSVAMNDADEIKDDKRYFKFNFKRELNKWMDIYPLFSKGTFDALMQVNEDLVQAFYNAFDDSGMKITDSKNAQRIPLIMFYIKMKSALNDIAEIENKEQNYPAPILWEYGNSVLKALTDQYPDVKNLKDQSGRGIEFMINHFDEYGKAAMRLDENK